MAQVNFLIDDDARMISGINGNGTSAITAGDILYNSSPTTSPFGTTAPSGTNYYDEIEVEPIKFATAVGDNAEGCVICGIALHDAAAGSQVTFATRGLFLSPVIDTTGALPGGWPVRAAEGTTTAGIAKCGTTTGFTAQEGRYPIGRSMTGANVDGKYCLWLLNIR